MRHRSHARALPRVASLGGVLCVFFGTGCGRAALTNAGTGPAQTARAPQTAPVFVSPFSYEWFVRAELLAARGEHAAAAEAYETALSSADDDPYLLARLADARDRAGDSAAATRALETALEVDPQSEAAWLERGEIAERHGEVAAALAAYERAQTAAPSAPDAPFALARLLRAQGSPERAAAVLERFAARSERGGAAALETRLELARTRDDGAALAEAARSAIARGLAPAARFSTLAAELFAAGRPTLALRVLLALPERERAPRLELALRLALMQREQVELLLATTPPGELGGPLAVADAYLQIGMPQGALGVLDQADGENDPNRRALLLGLALLDSGEPSRAALELARVPPDSAHHAAARRALVHALAAAGLPALGKEIAIETPTPAPASDKTH